MKENQHIGKVILGIVALAVLFIPLLQSKLGWIKESGLSGAIVPAEKPTFGWKQFLTGEFQEKNDAYVNENFGFRKSALRLHNQIQFSAFNHSTVSGAVVGNHDQMLLQSYIDTYTGKDFIGNSAIREMATKTKQIQDSLLLQGTLLLPMIAPGKANIYPEYIPNQPTEGYQTNYKSFTHMFDSLSLQYLDFERWFFNLKSKLPQPVFPKGGIHWTNYSEMLAVDSTLRYLSETQNLDIYQIDTTAVDYVAKVDSSQSDVYLLLNLLKSPQSNTSVAYPRYTKKPNIGSRKVRMLVIGDSFYNHLWSTNFDDTFIEQPNFWYYNRTPKNTIPNYPQDLQLLDLKEELKSYEVILIVCTDANLKEFAFGFVNRLYKEYVLGISKKNMEEMIEEVKQDILGKPEMMEQIRKKAEANGTTFEKQLQDDAVWIVNYKLEIASTYYNSKK